LPEVVGDAAILIDPCSSEKLCQAMHMVLANDSLRSKMRLQSLERARLFSWEQAAQETLAVYRDACLGSYQGERATRIGRQI
jgi:glycosyltransferase involved in cell wall biosynthesis